MTSRVRVSARSQPSPPLYPHFNRAFDLVSSRVWWEATTNNYLFLAFWPARSFFYPSVSGGLPPRLLPPSGGLGLSPGAWGAPNKGNADGAQGIFGNCRMRVGYGPAPGPTIKKGLVPYLPVRWGRQQISAFRGLYRFSAFWLGRLAFVPDGWSKPRADSGPNRPPASAGQPSGGRAAFSDPFCTLCIALDLTV